MLDHRPESLWGMTFLVFLEESTRWFVGSLAMVLGERMEARKSSRFWQVANKPFEAEGNTHNQGQFREK